MKKLKIGILGTRGIPNNYGGFEQIAGFLARGLVERGHSVTVYNSHNHPYRENSWDGINIIHKFDPERTIGTTGQFVYDFNCILDSRQQGFDIILMLGYTSSSIWGSLYDKKSKVVINMDGLEWKRSKYPWIIKQFLRLAERLGIKYAKDHIADSPVIKQYLDNKYKINSTYIPYGASIISDMDNSILEKLQVSKGNYFLLIARIEPENNIRMILEGFHQSNSANKFIVIGNTGNSLGRRMVEKYAGDSRILFTGSLYDQNKLFALTSHCAAYFHGHSVGGTNPSLLEAMAAKALIAAHANPFNRAILLDDGFYFSNAAEVKSLLEIQHPEEIISAMITNNYTKIVKDYTWEKVIDKYEMLFLRPALPLSS